MKNFYAATTLFLLLVVFGRFAIAATTLPTNLGGTGLTSPSGILYGDGTATCNTNNPSTCTLKTVTVGTGLTFTGGTLSSTGGGSTFGTTSITATYPIIWNTSTANISSGLATTTSNIWSALQQFNGNASSTYFSSTLASFGGTATTSVAADGQLNTQNVVIANNKTIQFAGYSALPQLYGGDSSTGIHFDAPGVLSVHGTGSQQSILSSTNRWGFGATTSPYAKFSVHAYPSETNTTLFAVASSTNSATTTLLTLNNIGRFGLSTSSPSAKFAVQGDDGLVYIKSTTNSSTTLQVENSQGSTTVAFGTQDTSGSLFRIGTSTDSNTFSGFFMSAINGFVGFGSSTPYANISIQAASSTTALAVAQLHDNTVYTPLAIDPFGSLVFNGETPTVGSCGTSPSVSGNMNNMTVTAGTGAVTSCAVTFPFVRFTTPKCQATIRSTTSTTTVVVVNESTSGVTLSTNNSIGGGTVNLFCPESN